MKIVLDSSILIKAYKEFSGPHRDFLEAIRVLNSISRNCLVYLCVNTEVLQDYEQLRHQNIPSFLEEAFLSWFGGIVNYSWPVGGKLGETEKKRLDCDHPIEHALIAFACENDKKIVATKDISAVEYKRCFFSKPKVISYLIDKEVSVIDVDEALTWIKNNLTITLKGSEKVELVNLSKKVGDTFDMKELRVLCFHLSVDYENLSASDKQNTVINIVSYFDRHGRLSDLQEYLQQERAHIQW